MTSAPISTSSTPLGASSSSSASTSSAWRRWTRTASRIKCRSAAEGALELAEHALVGAQVVLGHAVGELLEQLLLLLLQVPRNDDVDDHAQVAATASAQRGHSLAADRDR